MKKLILVFTILSIAAFGQDKKVSAKEIYDKINNGEVVEYSDAVIKGDLEIFKLKNAGSGYDDLVESFATAPVIFKNCTFDDKVLGYIHDDWEDETYAIMFENEVVFENCTFNDEVTFKYSHFDNKVSFAGSHFRDEVSFKYSQFRSFADYNNCEYTREATYKYTKFRKGASFQKAVFNRDVSFKYTEFTSPLKFKGIKFNDDAVFKYTKIDGESFTRFLIQNMD